jgi:hypothetical protein
MACFKIRFRSGGQYLCYYKRADSVVEACRSLSHWADSQSPPAEMRCVVQGPPIDLAEVNADLKAQDWEAGFFLPQPREPQQESAHTI